MSDLRFTYPVEYDAGYQLGRFGSKPAIRFSAYLSDDADAGERDARYTAFCEGQGDGTRDRWAAGGATERERELLERVHAAQAARGIVPMPMPPRLETDLDGRTSSEARPFSFALAGPGPGETHARIFWGKDTQPWGHALCSHPSAF